MCNILQKHTRVSLWNVRVKPGTLLHRPAQNAWKHIDHGSPVGLQSQYKATGAMIDWSPATILSSASSCPLSMPHLASLCSFFGVQVWYLKSMWIQTRSRSTRLGLKCVPDNVYASLYSHRLLVATGKLWNTWLDVFYLKWSLVNLVPGLVHVSCLAL